MTSVISGIIGTIAGTITGAFTQFFISRLFERKQLTCFNIKKKIIYTKEEDLYEHNTIECSFNEAQFLEIEVTFCLHWQGNQAITISNFHIYPLINNRKHNRDTFITKMPDKITGKYNIFYNTSGYLTIPNEEAIEVTMLSKIKKDDNCFCKADSLSILAIDIKNKSWKLI